MSLATAMTKSLLSNLPKEAAQEFELDEERFKTFLQTFLTNQLSKGARGKSTRTGAKGTNGKGRISGYLLFSNENRDRLRKENPDLTFTSVGKELGGMWKQLSESERQQWNERAVAENEKNGLPAKTPAPAKEAPRGRSQKAEGPAVSRHAESDKWVLDGTSYVVASSKSRVVVGRLNKENKVVALSANDQKSLKSKGIEFKVAEKK